MSQNASRGPGAEAMALSGALVEALAAFAGRLRWLGLDLSIVEKCATSASSPWPSERISGWKLGCPRSADPRVLGVLVTVDTRRRAVSWYAQSARWVLRFVAGTLGEVLAV